MGENKGDQSPEQRKRPAKDFFATFSFSPKRGLYLPKAIIDTDRPYGEQQHNRKRISRVLRGYVPYLTVLILAANAIIYAQQCGIMRGQSQTVSAQATIMATQAAMMQEANKFYELGLIAEVGIVKASPCDTTGNTILTFTNTGHTKATNVAISGKLYGTNVKVPENFDPFTAIDAMERERAQGRMDEYEKTRRHYLGIISSANVTAASKAAEIKRLNQVIDEQERAFKQMTHESFEKDRRFLPPSYVEEIPAGGIAEYPVSIGWDMARAGNTAFIYGTYGYDDELGHTHKNNRFCWRYESGRPSSCLQFQPKPVNTP